jgi:hypothetical protein
MRWKSVKAERPVSSLWKRDSSSSTKTQLRQCLLWWKKEKASLVDSAFFHAFSWLDGPFVFSTTFHYMQYKHFWDLKIVKNKKIQRVGSIFILNCVFLCLCGLCVKIQISLKILIWKYLYCLILHATL